jgi:ribA/ribD-fused uncharacterized protein
MKKYGYIQVEDNRPINFIESVWHYLSPFSAHQIEIWGETFATVEHAYHWKRYRNPQVKKELKTAKSPVACLDISRQYRENKELLDPAFNKDAVMEELFRAKMAQHPHIIEILKLSGTRGFLKEIPDDNYWGTGPDGSGQNRMGKLWMKLRSELV